MTVPYELPWSGEPLSGPICVFDTETTVVKSIAMECPRFVLATASDGERTVVIRSYQLPEFILLHKNKQWVGHNVAFDFLVVLEELLCRCGEGADDAIEMMWDLASSGQLHDTMLLDQLIQLGTSDGEWVDRKRKNKPLEKPRLFRHSLGTLATKWSCPIVPDKDEQYRMHFDRLLRCSNWNHPEVEGFFRYAAIDAWSTWWLFVELYKRALELSRNLQTLNRPESTYVYSDAVQRYGVLSESLQVQGAIALLAASRNGLAFNTEKADILEAKYRDEFSKHQNLLESKYRHLMKWYKKKQGFKITKKSGTPQFIRKELSSVLAGIALEHKITHPRSKGKLGLPSCSVKDWEQHKDLDPFLQAWCRMGFLVKALGFFDTFHKMQKQGHTRVHPSYEVIMRTGRTSSRNPNIQNQPRGAEFRAIYEASPGYLLYAVDYKYIELRTLAAICLQRQGKSVLAETILRGIDPHVYTGSMFSGVPPEAVTKASRQAAKAVNFGVPGGLGTDKLMLYALNNYKVKFTRQECDKLRSKLIHEVYPELNESTGYLSSTTIADISNNLGLKITDVLTKVRGVGEPGMVLYCLNKVLYQNPPKKKDGKPFNKAWTEKLWALMDELSRCSLSLETEFRNAILERKPSTRLHHRIVGSITVSPVGRSRSGVDYTVSKNMPFQALAADGIKLAMFRLCREGFRIAAMVHDELLVELPEATAGEGCKRVDEVMCSSMKEVMNHCIPAAVDGHLGKEWCKP